MWKCGGVVGGEVRFATDFCTVGQAVGQKRVSPGWKQQWCERVLVPFLTGEEEGIILLRKDGRDGGTSRCG